MVEIPIKTKKINNPIGGGTKPSVDKPTSEKSKQNQTKISKTTKQKSGFIPTSIPQLDNFLGGGIEENGLSCIWANPGLEVTPFAYQIANSVGKTKKVFYISNSKSLENVQKEMKLLGLKTDKINFVDSYSSLIGKKSSCDLVIDNPNDINELINSISTIVKKIKDSVIIIDSLSTLIDLTEKEDTEFLTKLKKLNATVICLFTEWPYKPVFIKSLRDIFDNIVEVSAIEEKLFFRQYFGVSKLKSGKLQKQAVPYRILRPGGVKIYIPKILVTGPFNAGKTSFIHTASEKSVSVDRLGTTIALDHGHVRYKDFAVDLFGTPGQQRFDPILKLLGGEALGVVVMISAIDPLGFPRAIEMMKKAKVYGLPVVFAANKSNLRGALKPEQIKQRLGLKLEEVIPITANDLTKVQPGLPCQLKREDIDKILDAIFTGLLKRGLK
jgi:uncharacterized protein